MGAHTIGKKSNPFGVVGFDSSRGLAVMTERKNIKLRQESYELLKEEKGEYETWDGMIHRLFGGDE